MIFRKPLKKDINDLIQLSKKFKNEYEWTAKVPIANIETKNQAEDSLFDKNIKHILVAEENDEMIAYLAIKRYQVDNRIGHEASIIVHPDYRQQGLAKKMTEQLFKEIPKDIEVEAWVLKDNIPSIKTVKPLGFTFNRIFSGDKRGQIYVKKRKK